MIASDVIKLDKARTELGHDLQQTRRIGVKWVCTQCSATVGVVRGFLTGSALDTICPAPKKEEIVQ